MPRAIQSAFGSFVAGAAGTGVAVPAAGDTFTVASFSLSSRAELAQVQGSGASTDFVRIRSPRLHDVNQGLRIYVGATKNRSLLPWELYEAVYPSDALTVEIDETAAATGGILVTFAYDDLPGAAPLLGTVADVMPRVVHTAGVEVDVTSGAAGTWGASQAINANFDNFEAGANYALLGYTVNAPVAALAITGKDTGNLKIGFPGDADPVYTRYYFVDASERSNAPFIPIIQANNKGSTILQAADTAAATAVKVTLLLAQLA